MDRLRGLRAMATKEKTDTSAVAKSRHRCSRGRGRQHTPSRKAYAAITISAAYPCCNPGADATATRIIASTKLQCHRGMGLSLKSKSDIADSHLPNVSYIGH